MAASLFRMRGPSWSSKSFSAIGRSSSGISFGNDEGDLVHLIFLIAVPQQMVNDYLICVGGLARRLNKEETRKALLEASTPGEFLEHLRRDD